MKSLPRKLLPVALAASIALAVYYGQIQKTTPVPPRHPTAKATASAPPQLPPPRWQPGQAQLGVNILFYDDPAVTTADLLARADRTAAYLDRLHANSAALAFPIFTPGPVADLVQATTRTPSPGRVEAVAARLISHGFRVTLRPLLDESSLQGGWRGTLEPTDRTAWFASYRNLLSPYITAAERSGTSTFDLGSELQSLETDKRWNALAAWARQVFHGEVAYAQNWGAWRKAGPHPATTIGVDAYPPMNHLPDNAPLADVTERWERWLASRPGSPADLAGTVLQEVGIAAQTGAYKAPYHYALVPGHRLVPALQATWFAAACRAQHTQHMGGIYFWAIDLNTDPTVRTANASPSDFVRQPAEEAIRNCFDMITHT